jgi:hypothetical protein
MQARFLWLKLLHPLWCPILGTAVHNQDFSNFITLLIQSP